MITICILFGSSFSAPPHSSQEPPTAAGCDAGKRSSTIWREVVGDATEAEAKVPAWWTGARKLSGPTPTTRAARSSRSRTGGGNATSSHAWSSLCQKRVGVQTRRVHEINIQPESLDRQAAPRPRSSNVDVGLWKMPQRPCLVGIRRRQFQTIKARPIRRSGLVGVREWIRARRLWRTPDQRHYSFKGHDRSRYFAITQGSGVTHGALSLCKRRHRSLASTRPAARMGTLDESGTGVRPEGKARWKARRICTTRKDG